MRYLSIVVFINKLVSININYVFKRYFCYGIFIFYVIMLLNFCIKLLPIHIFTAFLCFIIPQFCKHFNRFAGSNLSTDPKCPKCIYKIPKNFRAEKMKHSLREYEAQACGLYEATALPP